MRKGMTDVEIMRACDAYFRSAQHHAKPSDIAARSNVPGRIPLGKGRELLQAAA